MEMSIYFHCASFSGNMASCPVDVSVRKGAASSFFVCAISFILRMFSCGFTEEFCNTGFCP